MKKLLILLCLLLSVTASGQELKQYDIWPGFASAGPHYFTIFKGKLYFLADDSTHGGELYNIDAAGNLKMVSDYIPGKASGAVKSGGLWGYSAHSRHLAVMKDEQGKDKMLYLPGDNGYTGVELYKYDTVNFIQSLAYDFVPGIQGINTYAAHEYASLNDKVYFSHYPKGGSRCKLYMHDANLITGYAIDSSKSQIQNITAFKGKLYYTVWDTLFQYDPVAKKARHLMHYSISGGGSDIEYMHVIGNELYIGVEGGAKEGLYQYDGIASIPVNVAGYCHTYSYGLDRTWPIGEYKGKIYFPCADAKNYCQPCEYDPVTKIVKKLGGGGDNPHSFVSCKGSLYFVAHDSIHGNELWMYDGVKVPRIELELFIGKSDGNPVYLTSMANALYFVAGYAASSHEVLRYVPGTAPSAVNNVLFPGEVKLYPNPATDECKIELHLKEPAEIAAQLFDMTGKAIYTKATVAYPVGKSDIIFNIEGISPGIYYITLTDTKDALLYSSKILKE